MIYFIEFFDLTTFLLTFLSHKICPENIAVSFFSYSLYVKFVSAQQVADPETTTPYGCTCNTLCGATVDDGFTRDWCNVDGECGEYSVIYGYWDYCLYLDSSRPDYVALDWKGKQDFIWNLVKADSNWGEYHTANLFTNSLMTTFMDEWDVMPGT